LKAALILMALAATAVVAPVHAQDAKPAAPPREARAACAPPPAQLVKKDLALGTGREVKEHYAVLVGYTGWLYDGCAKDFKGAQFDTSQGRSTPFGFMVGAGKVIKGWDEGLVGMREKDARRLLVIPPDKGYGARGAGNVIPPDATLVFEVEVYQIVHPPAGEAGPAAKEPAKEKP
jgi:FKBP-type peptidyl-prolyl cis-trans isomerase FkpA